MAAETHRIKFHLVLQDWQRQSVFSGGWSREGFDILFLDWNRNLVLLLSADGRRQSWRGWQAKEYRGNWQFEDLSQILLRPSLDKRDSFPAAIGRLTSNYRIAYLAQEQYLFGSF